MKYWLLKTEPNEWSWKHQIESGSKGAVWDGVRNYQARNYLKKMKLGDQFFFITLAMKKRLLVLEK